MEPRDLKKRARSQLAAPWCPSCCDSADSLPTVLRTRQVPEFMWGHTLLRSFLRQLEDELSTLWGGICTVRYSSAINDTHWQSVWMS